MNPYSPHDAARRCARWLFLVASLLALAAQAQTDPLPSWNEGTAKARILAFVAAVTETGGKEFVAPAERIAAFDNDGTLWSEQPMYFQVLFALDRVRAMAKDHPEWKSKQPFQAVLEGDMKALAAGGERALTEIVTATHTGMTTDEFADTVREWIAAARHPKTGRPYTETVYQPMLELLSYLRASGFKTFIVSGGTTDFMRPWAEKAYGVPPEQVVGTMFRTEFELRAGQPVLRILPELWHNDDKGGKPVGIHAFIGRRPIAAFGNSDGDLQMLQWTTAGPGARLAMIVHHTDAEREAAYDRQSAVGRLDQALAEADARGWSLIDMKRDWKTVFPPR
jgi:phosphoserine phosphatase